MPNYFRKNYSKLNYPCGENGLRNSQLGAIHSIAAYFSLNKNEPAIVVMPTGSGKSAVLMMAPYVLQATRIIIVTPSAMVRSQIGDDFLSLSTLKKVGVFDSKIKNPKVLELQNLYNSILHEKIIIDSNVVIATPAVSLSISEDLSMVDKFDLIIIDEAHHVPAKTWTQILHNFSESKHLLLTATPFRRDNKDIVGEVIYNYPLSKAYEDGIFGAITYIPVETSSNNDLELAKKVEEVFYNDRAKNLDYYLMVRTDSKRDAMDLEKLYSEGTRLNLRRIDSSMTNNKIKQIIKELKEKNWMGLFVLIC